MYLRFSVEKGKNKRICILNDFSKGGIRVTYIRSKLTALKASWIKRLVCDNFVRWKLIQHYYFNNFGKYHIIFQMNFNQKCQFPFMDNSKISSFYKEIVLSDTHPPYFNPRPPPEAFSFSVARPPKGGCKLLSFVATPLWIFYNKRPIPICFYATYLLFPLVPK